jgi:hypothetical protein
MRSQRFRFLRSPLLRCLPAAFLLLLWLTPKLASAQTQNSSDTANADSNQSWSATTRQQLPSSLNPSRTSETHTEAGGRTIDNQSIETMGMYGRYSPYLDVQKETVKVDANTVRTIERAYGRDSDGRKTLVQVNEEEKRNLPGGAVKVVRTTSNPDANGGMQVVQREIQDTRQINPNVQETKSTFFTTSTNGGLAPSMQTTERDTKTSDHDVEFRRSTLLPDLNGGWQVGEVREGTVKEDGKDRTKDERVLRPGADGNLTVVERTVSKESENAAGEKRSAVETYSNNLPGSPVDDSLRLNQRVITVNRKNENGKQSTETQVEQRNPGQPSDRPRLTEQTIDIVRPALDGTTRQTQTLRSLNSSGGLGVVSVDTRTQDTSPAIHVDIAPATTPKAGSSH